MADRSLALTDKKLEQMENHLASIYRRAKREVGEKWVSYLNEMDDVIKPLQERLAKEEKENVREAIEKQIAKLMQERTLYDEHYQRLTEQLAQEILEVDRTAAAYVNDRLPEIYSINYNAIGRSAQSFVKGYSFELVNPTVVKNLATKDDTLLPYLDVDGQKVVRWNTQKLNAEVLQGILQGDPIPKIARRLNTVLDMEEKSAIRNARTAVTSAQNRGRFDSAKAAQDDGILMEKGWLAAIDSRTRQSHRDLNRTYVDMDEPFENGLMYPGDPDGAPEEVYNCFIGETKIATDSDIIRSYKHEYEGEVLTIKTAGGIEFTCTPNHPILTPSGWVHANGLHKGDNLIVARFGKFKRFGVNPDVHHVFPRIDALHELMDIVGRKRTCALGVDFHGDIPTSEVEIITQEGFLRDDFDTSRSQSGEKFSFKGPNAFATAFSHAMKCFCRIGKSALSSISGFCKAFPFFKRSLGHPYIHGLRPIAAIDSGTIKTIYDYGSCDPEFLGESLDGFTGVIFRDEIIDVQTVFFHGYVYNLQTGKGRYFVKSIIPEKEEKVNGIYAIAHNCRCTMITKFIGYRKSG